MTPMSYTPSQPAGPSPAAVPAGLPPDATWAAPVTRLHVGEIAPEAMNRNVEGRRLSGPLQGFGPLWQKTYRVRLDGADVTPEQVVAEWKRRFATFWPHTGRFYASMSEVTPGDVAVLNLTAGPLTICTGVLVLYADATSFTVMTPEGHQFAGFNTFSAYTDHATTVCQIHALIRASDPLWDAAMLVGHRVEDRFWQATLRNLAGHFDVSTAAPTTQRAKLDRRRQWRYWRNVRHNGLVRSLLWTVGAPARLLARRFARRGDPHPTERARA